MPFDIRPLGPGAVEISHIHLSLKPGGERLRLLHQLFAAHPILVFRDQKLSVGQVADFARLFGELEAYPAPAAGAAPWVAALEQNGRRATPDQRLYACREDESVLLMTNQIRADLAPLAIVDNAEIWHSDGSHKPTPYKAIALYAPSDPGRGGETEFCDMQALYAALPDSLKLGLAGKVAVHHWSKSRNPYFEKTLTPAGLADGERLARLIPEAAHPLICRGEQDERPHLFLSPRFTLEVRGLSSKASSLLLQNLFAMMEDRRFIYSHVWREGDLVLWDNRRTNHRVRAYAADQLRSRYRVTVSGAGPMRADQTMAASTQAA